MSTAASALPAFLRSFDLPEPGELRRVARVYVWGRWFVLSIATFAWLYPLNVDEVVYAPNVALAMLLLATNGYLHYRLATERTVSWRWMLALSALDLAMLSAGVAAHRGFESPFFVGYYPSLALFAVVFGSVRLTLVWVTMAAVVYAALCLAMEPGLDFSANDEEILLIRVAGMYTVVVVVNLISRVERIRRMEAVERERALQRERIELSHAIHNTMAQSAYMIGVGIERAKELADRSNEDLMSTLDETSALSRSAMWEMRHPMEIGEIFEGMELGGVLEAMEAMDNPKLSFNRRAIAQWGDIWLQAATPEYDIVGCGITILDSRTRDAQGNKAVAFTSGHIKFRQSLLVRPEDAERLAGYADLTEDVRVGGLAGTTGEHRLLELAGLVDEEGVLTGGTRVDTTQGVVVADGNSEYVITAAGEFSQERTRRPW